MKQIDLSISRPLPTSLGIEAASRPSAEWPALGPGILLRSKCSFESSVEAAMEAQDLERADKTQVHLAAGEPDSGFIADDLKLVRLDPATVVPGDYNMRLDSTWTGEEYQALKDSIARFGANIQPVTVRPVALYGLASYEVISGVRRHRACLELGLPLLARVLSVDDDREAFKRSVQDNLNRDDCSPFERGLQYKAALAMGLYGSAREMAEAVDLDHSTISKAVRLAELPQIVVEAFASPADIRVNWGARLHKALKGDGAGVLKRAADIAAESTRPSARLVFERLLPPKPVMSNAARTRLITLQRDAVKVATLKLPPTALKKGISVAFESNAVDERALIDVLQKLLNASQTELPHG